MRTPQDAPIEVTDARPFDYFWISREIGRPSPNGQTWAALLQPTCVSIYNILCLHTNAKRDEQREAFPSYATIAKECGISRQSAIDGIAKLIAFGFIAVKPSTSKYRTNIFIIQPVEKWVVAASCGRKPRQDKGSSNPKRHHNKLNDSQSDRLLEKTEIVNKIDSDSQSDRLLIVNQIDSDSQSDRPEVKSLKKSHLKESHEERGATKSQASKNSQNALTLSTSPSGLVFLSFFREESKRLSDFQIAQICAITDSELLKRAIEHLLGNGYSDAWNKVSLLKKVMQELSAAQVRAVPAGAGGAAGPAQHGALLKTDGNPVAFTAKAKQRQANLSFLNNLLVSPAEVTIDAQPLAAAVGV